MRPFHRGAYERLWAEHRYAVLAVSRKCCNAVGKMLDSESPRILNFLCRISRLSLEPKEEISYALLNVYDHLKKSLSWEERGSLINGIVSEDRAVLRGLYSQILNKSVSYLFGCRLFFPPIGVYKFWDSEEIAGLSICMGPYLLRVSPGQIRIRIESLTGICGSILDEFLRKLKTGIIREEFESWPSELRFILERCVMVAILPNMVFLHPRVPVPLPVGEIEEVSPGHAALLALEGVWDKFPEVFPTTPSFPIWKGEFTSEAISEVNWDCQSDKEEILAVISRVFSEQKNLEQNQPEIE